MTTPITAGDLLPAMNFTIGDRKQVADFSVLDGHPELVTITCYLHKTLLLDDIATSIVVAPDSKSANVTRTWNPGETDKPGLWRVFPTVEWSPGIVQTFPGMVLEVKRPGT